MCSCGVTRQILAGEAVGLMLTRRVSHQKEDGDQRNYLSPDLEER